MCDGVQKQLTECSITKALLKNFTIFNGKHLSWTLFLIKLQAWRPAALLKKDSKNNYSEEHLQTAAFEGS